MKFRRKVRTDLDGSSTSNFPCMIPRWTARIGRLPPVCVCVCGETSSLSPSESTNASIATNSLEKSSRRYIIRRAGNKFVSHCAIYRAKNARDTFVSLRVLAKGRIGYTAGENDYQAVRQILTVPLFKNFLQVITGWSRMQNLAGIAWDTCRCL